MKKLTLFFILTFAAISNCTEVLNENINFNLEGQSTSSYTVEVKNKHVGNVDISTHDKNTILIDVFKEATTRERLQKLEVRIDQADQKISIEAINNNKENEKETGWWSWSSGWFNFNSYTVNNKSDRIDLKIKTPKNCYIGVNTINGNINLKDIDKSINLESNLGSIDIDKAGNSVSINSKNGNLNLKEISGHLRIKNNLGNVIINNIKNGLDAKVITGDIDINNATGPLAVSVTSGSIHLHQATIQYSGEIDFKTIVGSINLYLPTNQDAILSAKTIIGPININNGKIYSQFEVGNSFQGPLISNPESNFKIFLNVTTGSINIWHQKMLLY